MDKKIYNILQNENFIDYLSLEILDAFHTKANNDTIEYDFDICEGKIQVIEPNTTLSYDTNENSNTERFKKALFDEDLQGLTKEEEETLVEDVSEFLKKVAIKVMEDWESHIRECLRKVIFPKSKEDEIPLSKIVITSIDIADFSAFPEPYKYILRIGKKPETFINTDAVTNYIHNRQEEMGWSVEEVYKNERYDNPLFENIIALERGQRYLYDVNITMFVDYSFGEKKEEIAEKE